MKRLFSTVMRNTYPLPNLQTIFVIYEIRIPYFITHTRARVKCLHVPKFSTSREWQRIGICFFKKIRYTYVTYTRVCYINCYITEAMKLSCVRAKVLERSRRTSAARPVNACMHVTVTGSSKIAYNPLPSHSLSLSVQGQKV